ncbi:MAG TPA: acetyl-CoA carboxylase carboxyltransferase subunit alpha [Gammaproteobacteria bacterium]|jgi:acetyl-CoA carboxylase carboxyl transferase subunit alpha|nr:acetyl-CoA carboxylase carboxyltransferase subunit alpha [Gammaproteobacteria bacterium]
MNINFLDFEQPIAELEAKIQELRMVGSADSGTDIDLSEEIAKLETKCNALIKETFNKLTPWQITQLARHPKRPHTLDYISRIFTDFDELHGDRMISAGPSIVAGLAYLEGQPVMVIGQEKGRKTQEKIERNFGMPHPEDYRKSLRLMELAERFKLPIITFIDTNGAYPGIGAEQRNQSEAIARNLFVMSRLKTQIICVVIGEGGSGGALALGVGDRIFMLQYAVYSVITPEGCASILWKSADKAPLAADAMNPTAEKALQLGLIDGIIPEPLGGAHRNYELMAQTLKNQLVQQLTELQSYPISVLLEERYNRIMSYGVDA